ncbi:MAG: hypothetical protein IKE04_05745 [Oscillospiraceae bacterium]|nr:hypothetical protein [Oscillospiraceae bacterium]
MRTQPPWQRDSEIGVALALCAVFGLDPESDEAIGFIRYTNRDGQNTPEADANRDVVYITLSTIQDPSTAWASTVYREDGSAAQTKTIPLSCLLSFYGMHANEYAEQARSGLMLDTGPGSPRFILRDHALVPVGWPDNPVTLPEPVGGVWRLRSDLRLRLNRLQVDSYPFDPMAQPPEIILRH